MERGRGGVTRGQSGRKVYTVGMKHFEALPKEFAWLGLIIVVCFHLFRPVVRAVI